MLLAPVNEHLAFDGLAGGTEEDVIPVHALPAHFRSTPRAGLPLAITHLHVVAHFLMDRLCRLRDMIDAVLDDGPNGAVQRCKIIGGQRCNNRLRMYLCFKENFVGIGIAYAAQSGVIVDENAHLLAGVFDCELFEVVFAEFFRAYVHTLIREAGNRCIVAGVNKVDLCHLLLITDIQPCAVIEFHGEQFESQRVVPLLLMLHASGKHEVHDDFDHGTQCETQEWPMIIDAREEKITQNIFHRITDDVADDHRLMDGGRDNAPIEDQALEVPTDIEEIGEFGHV